MHATGRAAEGTTEAWDMAGVETVPSCIIVHRAVPFLLSLYVVEAHNGGLISRRGWRPAA